MTGRRSAPTPVGCRAERDATPQTTRRRTKLLVFLLIVTPLWACATYPYAGPRPTVIPEYATLVNTNADVVITAVNAGWEIRAGQRTRPGRVYEYQGGVVGRNETGYRNMLGHPGVYEVNIARGTETYYGILVFFKVHANGTPAAQSRWAIEIPDQYYAGARNAGVSYVLGTYTYPDFRDRNRHLTTRSWMLWFSDTRFW